MDGADLELELGGKGEFKRKRVGVTELEWHNWKLRLEMFLNPTYGHRGGNKQEMETYGIFYSFMGHWDDLDDLDDFDGPMPNISESHYYYYFFIIEGAFGYSCMM